MSYPLAKFSDNEGVIDPEEFLIQEDRPQQRRWRALRYPVYFLCLTLGLVVLSQLLARPQTTQIGNALLSKADGIITSRMSTPATWIQTRNITQSASAQLEDALFHDSDTSITSPNKKFRFSFLHDGELLLETARTNDTTQWAPTWWAHSATYAKKLKDGTQYVALDNEGSLQVVRWVADGPTAFRMTHSWISTMQHACSDNINQAELLKSLRDAPKPQSLALDDTGRLIIFNATAHAVCILTDTNGVSHRPTTTISLEVDEAEWAEGDPIMDSERYNKHQFRAMLEADMEKQNLTFILNATQLDTIYNSAIIMPTWHGHKDPAIRFLKSMIRNCIDCDLWSINLIVATEDMDLFNHVVYENGDQSLQYFLPGLRILEFERLAFPHYDDKINVAEEVQNGQGKVVLQNFKKNYGCLATGKKYCSLLDSEGIIVRTTLYADVVREYLDAPFVIHDSNGRNADDPVSRVPGVPPVKELLDVPNLAKAGWLLEYYEWIMDASVLDAVAAIIAKKHPAATGLPRAYFTEVTYYTYIWAQLGPVPGPAYTFIESEQVVGERIYNATWRQVVTKDPDRRMGIGLIENMGWWMIDFPEMIIPTATRWNELGLRYFRAVETDYSPMNEAFVAMAKSVRLSVSSQPMGLYEAAMAGMLNL